MKIRFVGKDHPVVNITFTSYGVAVTYLDSEAAAPGLKLVTMSFAEFKQQVSFSEGI